VHNVTSLTFSSIKTLSVFVALSSLLRLPLVLNRRGAYLVGARVESAKQKALSVANTESAAITRRIKVLADGYMILLEGML
jgi:hypothetical protein